MKPTLRQPITSARASGTVMAADTSSDRDGPGNIPTSSPCRRIDPAETSSP